jgi:predicted nucleic acid-binding protein
MAASPLVDAGFLIALLSQRDHHHGWAAAQSPHLAPPWKTCEAVLSEAFFLLGSSGGPALTGLLRRRVLVSAFDLAAEMEPVLRLLRKYADVPMSLADACLVRMSEIHRESLVVTTDADFRIYRRHERRIIPCLTP